MDNLNWVGVAIIVVVALLIGGIIGFVISPSETKGLTSAECNSKTSDVLEQGVFQKNAEIETLKGLLEKCGNETAETETETEIFDFGYLVDELYLNDLLSDTYSDRELNLFDGEFDFDGKEYDAEETLILKDIELLANEDDFEGKVYLTLLEGAIEYKLEFEDNLNTSLIDEEETLEFSLLGEDVEISSWDNDAITIFRGTEIFANQGELINFEEYKIVLISVTDDSVYLSVQNSEGEFKTKIIDEDETRTINGLKIRIDDVFSSESKSFAELVLGIDIDTEIRDGEEYEEDSIWNWKINANSIGLVLNEDFLEIDSDEDFSAIGRNEKLCLPNEYVCVKFNGMDEKDSEEYSLELDERSGEEYVRVKGNFEYGTKDYDRIYVNSSGIYDRNLDLIDINEIELGDTNSILNISLGSLVFDDFEVNFDLNVTNVKDDEEDYLTDYGILVVNPENSMEDNEFNIFVPENKIEGSISLI